MSGDTDWAEEPRGIRWPFVLGVAGAVLGAMIIVALVFALSDATRTRDAALTERQQSYEAMILARSLDASIGQSEAFLGRFVISGDKDLGRQYFDNWRRAGAQLDALDKMISDPKTQPLIERLRNAYRTRGEELAAIALRTTYDQNPAALSRYYQAGKAPTLAEIDNVLDAIIDAERTTLDRRANVADATVLRSNRLGMIVSAFGLLIVIAAVALGSSALSAWQRRRGEEERNAELELAVTSRTAELSTANVQLIEEMASRAATEERLRQAQKMEAIGQLTGGIAHDFNNMLSVVIGGLELAMRRLSSGGGEAVERYLSQSLEGANRAAALTKRLLAFARAEPLLPVAIDPNALVADMTDLLDRTIGDTIAVKIEAEHEIWPVFVDPHQLENAILNLAVNARDAMPDGGTMTIRTGNIMLAAGEIDGCGAGEHVRIAVTDTGVGMTREVLDRAFEPFFTTKGTGQGTGLGLSQIFGFVRQSDGAVAVESESGVGTTVCIVLPRSHVEPEVAEKAASEALRALPKRRGTMALVVEDDPRVLLATAESLEELGLRTVRCNRPAEALEMLRGNAEIGLVVSDVLMPGMTGPELVMAIRKEHPGLPVLFVTGFAGDIDSAEAFGGHAVLRKPFTIASLGRAVEALLVNDPVRRKRAA
jgi:signal transduction histidine kinase/ActR/RegA family two-component response regulator